MELRKKWLLMLVLVMTIVVGTVSADGHSIAKIAEESEDFTVLSAAIEAAGLYPMLDGNGPFTVFAPTDDAFAKIPAEDLEAIVADSSLLRQILLYHIIQGEVPASEVVGLSSAQTALGKYITIDASDGVVLNGTSNVIAVDVDAENGIIHVIDTVLIPPAGWGSDVTETPPAPPAPPADGGGDDEGDDAGGDEPAPPPMDGINTQLADAIAKARFILEQMGGVLDRSNSGQAIACDEFNGYYTGLMALPTYTDEQLPPSLEGIHDKYREAVDKGLDTNMSIFELCEDGGTGTASPLNFSVARAGINDALGILHGLQELVGEGDSDAPAPADPPAADEPPADDTPPPADDAPPAIPPGIGADLLSAMEEARMAIEGMGGVLDRSSGGDSINCDQFLMLYEKLQALATYTDEQLPPETEGLHDNYRAAVDKALETNEAIYSGCEGGGTKSASPLNFGVARIGINDALNILIPTIEQAGPIIASLTPQEPPAPAPDGEDEPDPMPEEEMPEPDPEPEAPATTHPVDRDGDGNITYDDYLILGEEFAERFDVYVETEQPLPWNAEWFYLDTTFITTFIEIMLLEDPALDGMTAADVIREAPEDNCFLFVLLISIAVFPPEYSSVPQEWVGAYDTRFQITEDIFVSSFPLIDECLAGSEISDSAISQALDRLPEYVNRLNAVEVTGANLLGVESFSAMGGWAAVIEAFVNEQNSILSYAQYTTEYFNLAQNISLFK